MRVDGEARFRRTFFQKGERKLYLEEKNWGKFPGELSFSSIISIGGVQEAVSELKCIIESAMKRSI